MAELGNNSTAELVITIPEPFGASFAQETGTRTTLGVLIQLLVQGQRRVVLAAPFLQEDRGLSDPRLDAAMQATLGRKVVVNVVSTAASLRTLGLGAGHERQFHRPGP
jgi:hypothetical protein